MSDLEARVDALFELVQYLVEREQEREKAEKIKLQLQMESQYYTNQFLIGMRKKNGPSWIVDEAMEQ